MARKKFIIKIKNMSVRAYRQIKQKLSKNPSFNLWNDKELINFLSDNEGYFEYINSDNGGRVEVSTEALKKALKELDDLDDYQRQAIKKDINWANKNNEDYIIYECY